MSQKWFVKDGKRRQSNAKQCKGLVWKIKFARHFLKYSVISHQFVLPHFAECGVPLTCWMQLRNEKTKKNTRVLEGIAQ